MTPRGQHTRRGAVVALLLAGCGGDLVNGDDDGPDAGSGGDADSCAIGVTYNLSDPIAGQTVAAEATVPDAFGQPLEYLWTVDFDGTTPVPFDVLALDGSRISFVAEQAGFYRIHLAVSGSSCRDFWQDLNVEAPGATDTLWRFRIVPPIGAGAPPQEQLIAIPSGADHSLDQVVVADGEVVDGTVEDGSGAGVPAYLRLVPRETPDLAIDGFAGSSGAFSVRVLTVRHDVLVIPLRADLAPRRIANWLPLDGTAFTVGAGADVTGTVLDPAGDPIAGATVTVRIDGVPSSVGTTDGQGGFAVHAETPAGAPVVVDVVPPASRALPRLTSAATSLDVGQSLVVRYADSLTAVDVGGATVQQGGAAVASGTVTFAGSIPAAGTVTAGATQATAQGTFAVAVPTSASAVLASAQVPAAPASAVVTPSGQPSTLVAVNLAAGAPGAIAAPAVATLEGRVVGPGGAPIAGADVRIVPTGTLAIVDPDEAHAAAATDGTFALPASPGATYQLVIVDRDQAHALLRSELPVSGGADLGDLVLPDGLTVTGTLLLPGGSGAGAAVTVYCEDCVDAERRRPAAETAADSGGTFRATLVDPGIP